MTDEERMDHAVEHPVPSGDVKEVLMSIEATKSVMETDGKNAFVEDETGRISYIPDESGWESLHPDDVPGWVTENDALRDLANGQRLNQNPSEGGRWYRGRVFDKTPATTLETTH